MADYGLAAQIGRGNAMPGAQQQQDPQNRMMQMMQLQQLQQNMMLAREQEGRAAGLYGLQRQNLQTDIEAGKERARLTGAQAGGAELALEEQRRAQRINRGLIGVMGMVDDGKLDLSTPAGFNKIADVEVRMAARRQAAEIKEQNAKAEKAGYEANDVRRAQGYVFLDRTVPFIDGPATYNAALRKLLSVDPDAAEFVPNVYSPPNAQKLQEFVSTRRKSVLTIGGVPTLLNENTGVASELGIRKFDAAPSQGSRDTVSLPAGVQPPTQAQIGALAPSLGGTPATPQMGLDSARMAAGTPADVGAMQSGVPGQRLPVAGGANFQSLGSAGGPLPASQVIAEQAKAKSAATKMEALPKVQTNYVSAVESLDRQIRAVEDLLTRKGSLDYAVGPIAGRSLSPTGLFGDVQAAQAEIDSIKAGAGLAALKELRESSPNGTSGLGGASNEEGKRLENSIAALNQLQNPIDFRRQLATLKSDMERAKGRLAEAYKREYGGEAPGVKAPSRIQRIDNVTVTVGNVPYYFPNKAAADEFAKRAGM
jgi:hypothetical protein